MKKHTLLIAIGGFLLVLGLILTMNKKKEVIYYYETDLTIEEATSLVLEKTKTIMDVYEKQGTVFNLEEERETTNNDEEQNTDDSQTKTEQNKEYLLVTNFDEVIDELYTEDGKKEVENTKFNGKQFITKKDDKIYMLNKIPDYNSYSNCSISISDVSVTRDTVKAKVSFSKDKLESNDVLTYYVYEKDVELIKKDDKWLVNAFYYPNKKGE